VTATVKVWIESPGLKVSTPERAVKSLAEALPQAAALLEDGGRLGVISFHSGEDRVVKRAFRSLEHSGFVELEPSPVTAGREETAQNPRARSAKLRVLARREAA